MRRLVDLLDPNLVVSYSGDPFVEVSGISHDSRKVEPGYAFVCITGFKDDGNRYAGEAIAKGAVGIVSERPKPAMERPGDREDSTVTWALTVNSRLALAAMSDAFYGHPSRRLRMIGVTGTNGKGTICSMISSILDAAGSPNAMLGTIFNKLRGESFPSYATTPESVHLQAFLARSAEAGAKYAAVEVSSHAVALGRVFRCEFDVGVLSGITRDHLDFHGTMEAYITAKKDFMRQVGTNGVKDIRKKYCVLNLDDPNARDVADEIAVEVVTYGLSPRADVFAEKVMLEPWGSEVLASIFGKKRVFRVPVPGLHNVYNALAAVAVASKESVDWHIISAGLQAYKPLPGRWERVLAGQDFEVIVDFAHNPDGLEHALRTAHLCSRGKKIVVFGCEGRKDPGKRRPMGRVAASLADFVIVTSDNSYDEEPERIAREIEAGIKDVASNPSRYAIILDRRQAIRRALTIAEKGDLVLIAGKGHEKTLVMGNERIPFDDASVTREIIAELRGEPAPVAPPDIPTAQAYAAETVLSPAHA